MPPSSFSGAGAGFVPLNRQPNTAPGSNYADGVTDAANQAIKVNTLAPAPQLSQQALGAVGRQDNYAQAPLARAIVGRGAEVAAQTVAQAQQQRLQRQQAMKQRQALVTARLAQMGQTRPGLLNNQNIA